MRCFVLVLFLCGLAAGTTLPTPHGLTKQPSAQDLRLLPHGLTPRNIQEGALSGGIRALLATTIRDCAWSRSDKVCLLSRAALIKLLRKSGSGLAKYILGEYVCFAEAMKPTCNNLVQCEWDDEEERCSLDDISYGYDNSPCVKAAPVLFKVVHYGTICSKIETKLSCSTTKHCQWSGDDDSCAIDFFEVAFHLKAYRQKTSEVFSAMVQEKSAAISKDPKLKASKFAWEAILKWKPPKGTCPKGQQKGICDVVEAYTSVYLPVLIYCQGKYTTEAACKKDKLCKVGGYGNCIPSEEVTQKAGRALVDVLIGMVSGKADKFYLSSLYLCSDNTNLHKCHAGGCTWNLKTKKCHLNSGALFRAVVKEGGSTKDGLCAFLDAVSSKKCDEMQFKRMCAKRKECEWEDSSGCTIDGEEIVIGALKGSSGALRDYTKLGKKCAAKDSKDACTGSSSKADAVIYVQ